MSPFWQLCIIYLVTSLKSVIGEFTAEDCWQLGMDKTGLMCSSCDLLKKFNLMDLREHCMNCCTPDEKTESIKRYPKARLEVCTCKFGTYPQIQAFVQGDKPSKFPNLSIRYVRGLDPIIKLMDNNGEVQEVLAIEKWDTDAVEEFLNTHLENDEDNRDYLKTNTI